MNAEKDSTLINLFVNHIKNLAIFTLNTKGIIVSWNPGARELFGYHGKEAIGQPLSFLFPNLHTSNKLHKDLQKAIDMGQYIHETSIITKKGKHIWVNCVVTALWNKKKELEGFSKLVEDISQRKMKEKKRDEFISLISHELKNPLTSIKSYVQIIQHMMQKDKPYKELLVLLAKLDSQVDKLSTLLSDLFDISKIAIGTLSYKDNKRISIDKTIHAVVDGLAPTFPSHVISIRGKTNFSFVADKSRIEQVITNLLINAIKYSPRAKKVVIKLAQTSRVVTIAIQDFGIGIKKKDMKEIFRLFSRLPEAREVTDGLGIGLHVTLEIIKHYHGSIRVKSTVGKGTTFFIQFPRRKKKSL